MPLLDSELILNPDGSIYHLHLLPTDVAHTIITVGDPDRVSKISKHFDTVQIRKGKREFITHTGVLNGKRLSVISTGIGTDNIDIVLNELDALVNIDFKTRTPIENRIRLDIIRLGTSGAIQADIPVDSFLMTEYVIGFDGLLHFYKSNATEYTEIEDAFISQTKWSKERARPYVCTYDAELAGLVYDNRIRLGFTATNTGFYGPQGRTLRLPLSDNTMLGGMRGFAYNTMRITNLEMETSGIYLLAKLLGHRAVSLNCILANRVTGAFSAQPEIVVEELIKLTLQKLTSK